MINGCEMETEERRTCLKLNSFLIFLVGANGMGSGELERVPQLGLGLERERLKY
jgi:hypothetical protein